MNHFYMQDKRSKKKMPPTGTRKYPVIYLGTGRLDNDSIIIDENSPNIPVEIDPKFWRFYISNGEEGEYLKIIVSIQFESSWILREIRDE